jgi:hypothetical protein
VRQRKGPVQKTVGGVTDSVIGAVRRRQQERTPRVTLYDAAGHARVLQPDAPGQAELVETAEELVALVPRRPGPPAGEADQPGDATGSGEAAE